MFNMIISIINQKGGSGKTALSILISLALASTNKRVLSIDTDSQAGMTSFLIDKLANRDGSLFDVLAGLQNIGNVIKQVKRERLTFYLAPADYRLDSIAATLDPYALQRITSGLNSYDYIIIDTPPTIQGISRAAAMIADKIFIPADISQATIKPTLYSIEKLKEIKKSGQVVLIGYKEYSPERQGYLPDINREFMQAVKPYYAGTIPRRVSMLRAISQHDKHWTAGQINNLLSPILNIIGE